MKIYLSGKISGLTEAEYTENFKKAWCKIIELFPIVEKHYYSMVVNPLEIKPLFGIKKWFFYIVADMWQLRKCSHIAMQPNWIESKGAWLEYGYAKFILKLKVIYL